jgi:hypothetical protein
MARKTARRQNRRKQTRRRQRGGNIFNALKKVAGGTHHPRKGSAATLSTFDIKCKYVDGHEKIIKTLTDLDPTLQEILTKLNNPEVMKQLANVLCNDNNAPDHVQPVDSPGQHIDLPVQPIRPLIITNIPVGSTNNTLPVKIMAEPVDNETLADLYRKLKIANVLLEHTTDKRDKTTLTGKISNIAKQIENHKLHRMAHSH